MWPVKVECALVVDDRFEFVWDFTEGDLHEFVLQHWLRAICPLAQNSFGGRYWLALIVFGFSYFVRDLLC